jgi:hypothetical protein
MQLISKGFMKDREGIYICTCRFVCELSNCPLRTQYDIMGIPQNFLIDPNGMIVAKNLRGEKLEETLEQQLNK